MTTRECALRYAGLFEGVCERPPHSNSGPTLRRQDWNGKWVTGGITQWLNDAGIKQPAAWCMAFVHGMFKLCGVTLGGWASVGNFLQWAAQHGDVVARPRRGDLACYFWDADDWADHIEFVSRVLALRWRGDTFIGYIETIGGNTGDCVKRQRRWVQRAKFVRIEG